MSRQPFASEVNGPPDELDLDPELGRRDARASEASHRRGVVEKYCVRVAKLHRDLRLASFGTDRCRVGSDDELTIDSRRWGRWIWKAARRWRMVAEANEKDRAGADCPLPQSMLAPDDLKQRPVPEEGVGFQAGMNLFEFAQHAPHPDAVIERLGRYREKLGSPAKAGAGVGRADTELGIRGYLRQLDYYFEGTRWSPPPTTPSGNDKPRGKRSPPTIESKTLATADSPKVASPNVPPMTPSANVVEIEAPIRAVAPSVPITPPARGWKMILAVLNVKTTVLGFRQTKDAIRRLNGETDGPIIWPGKRGRQPIAAISALHAWRTIVEQHLEALAQRRDRLALPGTGSERIEVEKMLGGAARATKRPN